MSGFIAYAAMVMLVVLICVGAASEDNCAKKHDVYECEWVLVPVTPKGETK